MQFNSVQFMQFFPVALAICFIVPKKLRVYWLLCCSYFFYMSWNRYYALLMLASTIATFAAGLALDKLHRGSASMPAPGSYEYPVMTQFAENTPEAELKRTKKKKLILGICIGFNLAILGLFKYGNMALATVGSSRTLSLLLPVGISFYTFQALGYIIDVYRGEVAAEYNFANYALFVSFFPQLVAGPIERSKNLLKQVREAHNIRMWDAERVTSGAILMVWGFFLKMVISDRAALLADAVWADYASFGKLALILASLAFTLQIYCDFGGYSMIAIGAAKMLGFSLMENFNTPYFATSIKDFWARWHISLSTWFRDYLYIPLGGSRRGKARKYVNLMATFLLSGLWHGADWSFVLWGGLHGIARVLEEFFGGLFGGKRSGSANLQNSASSEAPGPRAAKHVRIRKGSPLHICTAAVKWLCTFLFVNFAWIFFRASSIADGIGFVKRMAALSTPLGSEFGLLAGCGADGAALSIGLDKLEFAVLFAARAVLFIFGIIKRRTGETLDAFLTKQKILTEWAVIIGLILCIFVFGEYGPTFDPKAFIYFQF